MRAIPLVLLLTVAVPGAYLFGQDDRGLPDKPAVLYVVASESAGGWSFDVTVEHHDEGWDHYADAWQILDPETGGVIGERVLLHPHETEQPFTRSLTGVVIPEDAGSIAVRAHCNVHGYGDALVVSFETDGDGYEIHRSGSSKEQNP